MQYGNDIDETLTRTQGQAKPDTRKPMKYLPVRDSTIT